MRYSVIGYFLSEGFRNVFKNKKSTISCLGVMCVTMLMFGVFFSIGKNITHMVENVEDSQAIRVFFKNDATEEEISEMKEKIMAINGVATAERRTKEDAFNEAKKYLDGHTSLMDGMEPDFFSDSYIVTLSDLDLNESVQAEMQKLPHFKRIASSNQTISALSTIGKWIRIVTGTILVILILISIFIIANTIKLTVHARRKEISIMKYVGATNSFIRWPFIVEGIIIGLMSGAISLALVASLYMVISQNTTFVGFLSNLGLRLLDFSDMFNLILIIYLVLGVGIGVLGSSLSMRKYLKV